MLKENIYLFNLMKRTSPEM